MAGTYVNIIFPGYTNLFTRDLPYTSGTNEASDLNPFDPAGARPLVEGEWLERDGDRVKRGGANPTADGDLRNEGEFPAFLYFNEKGRYDAQLSRRAHCIYGPAAFEFRTKLCCTEDLAVGDKVSVWDYAGPSGSWGVTRRALAKADSGNAFIVGRVTRIFGTDDIAVMFLPA
jgi:hypothetical protein